MDEGGGKGVNGIKSTAVGCLVGGWMPGCWLAVIRIQWNVICGRNGQIEYLNVH